MEYLDVWSQAGLFSLLVLYGIACFYYGRRTMRQDMMNLIADLCKNYEERGVLK